MVWPYVTDFNFEKSEQKFHGEGKEKASNKYFKLIKPHVLGIIGKALIYTNYSYHANCHGVIGDVTRGQKVTNFEEG